MRRGYLPSNIPAVLENYPEGYDVADMPVIDNFNYVPRIEDLDYDRDAVTLLQLSGPSCPHFDPWPSFLKRPASWTPQHCKLTQEDQVDTEVREVATVPAEEAGRPELLFGDLAEILHQLQFTWDAFSAVEREDEGRVLYVQTWYTDHDRARHCHTPRPVRLLAAVWNWPDLIAEAWDDLVDPDAVLDIYMLRPMPRQRSWSTEEAVPHVVIVQHPHRDFRSAHLTVVDMEDRANPSKSYVQVIPAYVDKHIFYDILGIGSERMVASLVDCMVSHGEVDINEGDVYAVQHGFSFVIIRNHLRNIVSRAAASQSSSSHGPHLLQTSVQKKSIFLAALLDEPSYDVSLENPDTEALHVVWAAEAAPHPSFVEVKMHCTNEEIAQEFLRWGLQCRAVSCKERGQVVCMPSDRGSHPGQHYVFVNMDISDEEAIFLHTTMEPMSTQAIMAHLHGLGYWRAVVLDHERPHDGIHKVSFQEQKVQIQQTQRKAKATPAWPPHQPTANTSGPFFEKRQFFESPQLIDIGVTEEDLQELFASHAEILQPNFDGVDLPEDLRAATDECDQTLRRQDLDRILIYTDGSSVGPSKHLPPLRAEEEGSGDTWAMVVVGERYEPPGVTLLGWCAQPVIYDTTNRMHLGAQRVGADLAEREGLSWAALWRVSQNWNIATCFRSDSNTALGQAAGILGTSHIDDSFAFLRGAHQAVDAAVSPLKCAYTHTYPDMLGSPGTSFAIGWLRPKDRRASTANVLVWTWENGGLRCGIYGWFWAHKETFHNFAARAFTHQPQVFLQTSSLRIRFRMMGSRFAPSSTT